MPRAFVHPVERRLDEEAERVPTPAEDVQSIRELLGHPCQLLGEGHRHLADHGEGRPVGPGPREVEDGDRREDDAEEPEHRVSAHPHVLDRHRDADDAVRQRVHRRDEDEGECQDDGRYRPSMMRSATTELVAAVIVMARSPGFRSSGRVRMMYGRTNSPMRNGMRRMAAKPMHETAKRRFFGTSATPRSRKRHRTLRAQL